MDVLILDRRRTVLGFFDHHRFELIALFDVVDDVLACGNLPKYGVLAIQPIGHHVRDEELAAVRVRPGVSHRKRSDLVLARIVTSFVFEFITGTAGARGGGIAALDHEVRNDAMKDRAIVETFASQEDKIVDGLRGVFGK